MTTFEKYINKIKNSTLHLMGIKFDDICFIKQQTQEQ